MINLDMIEMLAAKLSNAVPGCADALKHDLQTNFKAILQSSFAKLSLVNREEFDRQCQALAKARTRLAELELRIQELEQQR
jgi:BMFP domain-containing protein YqiC